MLPEMQSQLSVEGHTAEDSNFSRRPGCGKREKAETFMTKINDAYELLEKEELGDIGSEGLLLRHKKSGATLVLLQNDDDNKVFYIGFRTPPADSTGVAHIIEHSVLCGSDRYPVKDPFVELVKGSLNTFLNAMTYPDKTVYPVASCNDKDFDNLIDVYMDAVFHPRIYSRPEIFMQEGWHYELENREDPIKINGVVYNEMKGAFSSPDDVLERQVMNSLFPDTPYGVESGGDPACIPDLTYEDFLDFHRRYYHPCNAYIYLYGNFDAEDKLDYLDRVYLSHYEVIELDSRIPLQRPFEQMSRLEKTYPISAEEDEEGASYLSYNLAVATALDPMLYQAFKILDYALLNSPGAPVKKALIDAGIGKDIYGGYDSGTLQPVFSITARGANPEDEKAFLEIIRKTLTDQAEGGIDPRALYAAINMAQFHFREADYGRYPKGLIWGLQLLDSWLYDERQPFLHLHVSRVLEELRERVSQGYFEQLIRQYLLENTHASLVKLVPERGLASRRNQALAGKMAAYKAGLSAEEIEALVEQTRHLQEYQEREDSPEELAKIPMLKREDLRREIDPIDCQVKKSGNFTVLHHNVETNGIHYLTLVFAASHIAQEDLGFLSFLTRLLGQVDTERYSYTDLTNAINLTSGGISTSIENYPGRDGSYQLAVEVHAKFFYSDMDPVVRLMEELMLTSSFADSRRLKELLDEEILRMEARLMSSGHTVAANRAGSYFSAAGKVSDEIGGIGYYRFLKETAEDFDEKAGPVRDKLVNLQHAIFRPENMLVSSTSGQEGIRQVEGCLPQIEERLYRDHYSLPKAEKIVTSDPNEAFKSASQVNYVARCGDFGREGFAYQGAMRILDTILGYDYFWNNIRVKGGAYGCMSSFSRNAQLVFMSYRDPRLQETKEVFDQTPDFLRAFDANERDMTRFIIGTLSGMDTPLTPSMRGSRGLAAYMSGLTDRVLQKERDQIIHAGAEDIRRLAEPVEAALRQGYICVVGNEDAIEAKRELFSRVESLL